METVSSQNPTRIVDCKTELRLSPVPVLFVAEKLESDGKNEESVPVSPAPSSSSTTSNTSPTKSKKETWSLLSSRLRTIVKNLQYLWPPAVDKTEEESKKEFKFIKKSLFKPASKMLKGSNYSSTKHSQINFMKLLEDAFTDNHFLNQLTLKHLQEKTGLSSTAITAWFKWKRSETGYLTPKQVLIATFNNSQYLTQREIDDLVSNILWTKEEIKSWFRVSRALANVFAVEKADQEELILQQMFRLHKTGIRDCHVSVMSHLLKMDEKHVHTIFLTWCQRYDVPNYMTSLKTSWDNACAPSRFDQIISRMKNSKMSICLQQGLRRCLSESDICSVVENKRLTDNSKLDQVKTRPISYSAPGRIESSVFKPKSSGSMEKLKTQEKGPDHPTIESLNQSFSDEGDLIIDIDSSDADMDEYKATTTPSRVTESSFPDQSNTTTHDEESYDVTNHDVIIRELKKLRKEQLRDGIPWKTPMSKGVSDLDRIVITKRKRRKRKKRKSLTYHPYQPKRSRNSESSEECHVSVLEMKSTEETDVHIGEIFTLKTKEETSKTQQPSPSSSISESVLSAEERLFELLQENETESGEETGL